MNIVQAGDNKARGQAVALRLKNIGKEDLWNSKVLRAGSSFKRFKKEFPEFDEGDFSGRDSESEGFGAEGSVSRQMAELLNQMPTSAETDEGWIQCF